MPAHQIGGEARYRQMKTSRSHAYGFRDRRLEMDDTCDRCGPAVRLFWPQRAVVSASPSGGSEEAEDAGMLHGLATAMGAELFVQMAPVSPDGVDGYEEFGRDLGR